MFHPTFAPSLGLGQSTYQVGSAGEQHASRPYDGVNYTIDDMRRLVHDALTREQQPALRQLVESIIAQVTPKDYLSEIAALYYYVLKNVRYTRDPLHIELVQHPYLVLQPRDADRAAGRRGRNVDCFPMSTKIICRSKSTGQYELMRLGDLRLVYPAYEALSYNFRTTSYEFRQITAFQDKGEKSVLKARLSNGTHLVATPEHKFWALDGGRNGNYKVEVRCLGEYAEYMKWSGKQIHKRVQHCRILQAARIPTLDLPGLSRAQAYLAGIYAAEGYSTTRWQTSIAQSKLPIREKIEEALAEVGASNRFTPPRPSAKTPGSGAYYALRIGGEDGDGGALIDALREQGSNSFDMRLPMQALSGTREIVQTVIDAYGDGDAYHPKPGSNWYGKVNAIHATSSDEMAEHLRLGMLELGRPFYLQHQKNHQGVGTKPIWRLYEWCGPGLRARREKTEDILPGMSYGTIKSIEDAGTEHVGCITVEENHNFVLADGTLASNCDEMATTLAAMVMSIGNRAEFVTISTDRSQGFHHVFCVVHTPDNLRIVLDPVPGPNTSEMIAATVKYQAWPIEPVRIPGRMNNWQPLARPMQGR